MGSVIFYPSPAVPVASMFVSYLAYVPISGSGCCGLAEGCNLGVEAQVVQASTKGCFSDNRQICEICWEFVCTFLL